MIVDPDSLKSAAKAMRYSEREKGMIDLYYSGSQSMGRWDDPRSNALKLGLIDPDGETYDNRITESISLIFCKAMKTAETLSNEVAATRTDTADALLKVVKNVEKAEDANENNAFKVFLDPH